MSTLEEKDRTVDFSDLDLPESVINRLDEIVDPLEDTLNKRQCTQIKKAFHFAAKAHGGQTRISGDAYITHPLEVMGILSTLQVDAVTLIGALLHDVVEDTGLSVEDVAREFGPVVALLVDGMTKLSTLVYDARSNEERQAEYFRKMLLSMAQDLRVILIKLADRLHNMRTLEVMPQKSKMRIARETLEIYAPLAHRFGIGKVKWELEDLSLKVLDETSYRRIAERVSMRREEREGALGNVVKPLESRLKLEGVNAKVIGRAKHFYSIYNKIKRRGKSFDEILDLLAVRVIVETIPDCYRTLGVVHSMFTPIIERFSDYIAMPKGNMYQSLHTKVIDNGGRTVEVQIRTAEMDQIAEVGIAAHWRYKEGEGDKTLKQDTLADYYRWLRQVIEGSREEDTSEEFMQTLRTNLFTDEVFVFTPKGKLIQLPKESSPIDFAFAVHTDVGLHTLGAKVNGKMVPLDYILTSGVTVEILTSTTARPSLDWLRYVRSSRARSKIKRFFRQTQVEESIRIGEEILRRELSKHHKKTTRKVITELVENWGFESAEAFFAAIGAGDLSPTRIARKYVGEEIEEKKEPEPPGKGIIRPRKKDTTAVKVKGLDNLMIRFGSCCSPLPGDRIIGYLSKGRGIIVHRTDCSNVADLSKDPEKLVHVEWDIQGEMRFESRLRIFAEDRQHLLHDVSEVFNKMDVNIVEVNLRTEGSLAVGTLAITVKNLAQLSKIMNRINKIKSVVQVERINVSDVAEKIA